MGANNEAKLRALKAGEVYDEERVPDPADVAGDSTSNSSSTPALPNLSVSVAASFASGSYLNSSLDSSTFAVSGTCAPDGTLIAVKIDGSAAPGGTGAVCNSSSWVATLDSTALAAGLHTLSAVLSHGSGAAASATGVLFTRDVTAPALAIGVPAASSSINASSNSATFTVSGTCDEASATVGVRVDGSSASSQVGGICDGSNWTSTIDVTGLSAGAHSISATLADAAGNTRTAAGVGVSKDANIPTVALTAPSSGAYINASSTSATYAVSGTCDEASTTVGVLVDGSAAPGLTGGSCDGSNWSATIDTTGFSAGAHTLSATLTDGAGNSATPSTASVTLDVTAPSVAITSPANSSFVHSGNDSASFAVSGTCNENSRAISVQVDGSASGSGGTCNGTTWSASINTTGLSEAAHTLTAQLSDAAGNATTSSAIVVTRDVTAPVVAVTTPSASSYVNSANNGASYAVSGTCSGSTSSVAVRVDGAAASGQSGGACSGGSWSATINTSALSAAAHTISATLADSSGNTGTAAGVVVTKDVTAPSLAIGAPGDNQPINSSTDQTAFSVNGSCNEASRAVTLRVDGSVSGSGATCNGTSWAGTINTSSLSEANHTISATISDVAGNSRVVSVVVFKDLTPPSIAITRPKTGNLITAYNNTTYYYVGGTCSGGTTWVTVAIDGSAANIPNMGACDGASWSVGVDVTNLASGAHTLSASLFDLAGNEGTTASGVVVTKDLSKPSGGPTFTRASAAFHPESTSDVYAANQPRYVGKWDSVTGADLLGLLVEAGTSNTVPEGNFENWTGGSPDGWTVGGNLVVTQGSFGGSHVELYATNGGLFSGNTLLTNGAVVGDNTTYTLTARVRRLSGTLPLYVHVPSDPASPVAFFSDASNAGPYAQFQDVSYTFTTGDTGGGGPIQFMPIAANETFGIDNVQISPGNQATSYTTSAAPRADESMMIPTSGALNAAEGAIVVRAWVAETAPSTPRYLFEHATSAAANTIAIYRDGSTTYGEIRSSGGTLTRVSTTTALSVGIHTFGLRWSASEMSLWIDGVKEGTHSAAVVAPTLTTTIGVGNRYDGSSHWNNVMDYFSTYFAPPTDDEMAMITAVNASPRQEDFAYHFNSVTFARAGAARDNWSGVEAASGVPRFANTGKAVGLMVEGTGTNLFTQTNDLTHSNWIKTNATVVANGTLGPETAFTLTRTDYDTSDGVSQAYDVLANVWYTQSALVKAGTHDVALMEWRNGTEKMWATFNLATGATQILGTTYQTFFAPIATMLPMGNGVWWINLNAMISSSAPASGDFSVSFSTGPTTDIGHSILVSSPQFEPYKTPTSYVRALASEPSRAAETLKIANLGLFQGYNGTVLIRAYFDNQTDAAAGYLLDTGSSDTQNRITLYKRFSGMGGMGFEFRILGNTGNDHVFQWGDVYSPGFHNIVVRWTSSDKLAVWVDGVKAGETPYTDTAYNIGSEIYLGSDRNGSNQYGQPIQSVFFWDSALADQDAQDFSGGALPKNYKGKFVFSNGLAY